MGYRVGDEVLVDELAAGATGRVLPPAGGLTVLGLAAGVLPHLTATCRRSRSAGWTA